ncbi:uncharacterized protein VP01_1145g1, partial [Puccinia sorghi]
METYNVLSTQELKGDGMKGKPSVVCIHKEIQSMIYHHVWEDNSQANEWKKELESFDCSSGAQSLPPSGKLDHIWNGPQILQDAHKFQLGTAMFLLGITLDFINGGFVFHQDQYFKLKLAEVNVTNFPPDSCPIDLSSHLSKASQTNQQQFLTFGTNYQPLIGSLNYLGIVTHQNLFFCEKTITALQFMKGPTNRSLSFVKQSQSTLLFFVNADWENCTTHKSRDDSWHFT